MKNITKTIILATAVTALAVLLLAGCREYRIETNTMDGITI